ncbi:MAG TPA: IclR family transcriptional regulator [Anaerolineae bacterium]|nr:IclR family transcriptional regulator [Anaerolineae bacterium]MCB0225645.1 IclR family transcriptional regulator [Anaerolineae bacterium]MCB9109466.1 IclR family transcriptional regulator [Anaerolineales bacterium]HRV91712.1 IclR family transcriptional regulator [Anaerolineae bacterium]
MTENSSSDSGIQSVQRAAAILRCFTKTEPELSVTAIGELLGLHKSTVSRLLATLKQEGLVEQVSETGKYRLGLTLVTLAGIVLENIDLRQVAHPYLQALAEKTQETVNIVILDGDECVNIDGVTSPRPIKYIGRMGRRTPTYCTAAGKVLLAYLAPDQQRDALPNNLIQFTENTIVTRQHLLQSLVQVREQGYAVVHEELQPGVSSVAAPVCDHSQSVCAAVTISGPTYRIGADEVLSFLQPLQETAHGISAQLGCVL